MRKYAEILTIGDELLKGSTVNTNAAFLGCELTAMGFRVRGQCACPDRIEDIHSKLSESIGRSDLLILSGGLGPTPDDVTRDALASFFRVPLVFSKSQFALIRKLYRRYDKKVPHTVRKESLFPQNAAPLLNRYGIALGFSIQAGGCLIIVLPGVPVELEKMFRELVRPLIRRRFPKLAARPSLVVKTVGRSEPDIMKGLGRDFFSEKFDFGIYPEAGEVAIRISSDRALTIRKLKGKIKRRLGDSIYAWENLSLAEAVGVLLKKRRQTLSVAESCTGGLLAGEITKVPGSSCYFRGGVVAYDNEVKSGWLGISEELLRQKGAVSEEIALALADQIRIKMKTTYGIGITGIAGPAGGTARKPVGLVYTALAAPRKNRVWKNKFWGARDQVRIKAVKKSLEHLWREIR